jgi:zinc transporter, ZIP family
MIVLAVICVTSAALIVGALWGLKGSFPRSVEGFVVSMAGGALIVSIVAELLQPASKEVALWALMASFGAGAVIFAAVDLWIERSVGEDSGGGLLAAIVMDGVPENLALGVALIGAEPITVLALAGSIFLSNLPEAAGGAKGMRDNGMKTRNALLLWTATAAILSVAALAGYYLLDDAPKYMLALIQGFAAGAVVSSLATEIFPKAYDDDHQLSGVAVATGVMLAFVLNVIGGG